MNAVQLFLRLADIGFRQRTLGRLLVDEAHRAIDQADRLMVLNRHNDHVQRVVKLAKLDAVETPCAEVDDRWNYLLAKDQHNRLHDVDDLPGQLFMPDAVLE